MTTVLTFFTVALIALVLLQHKVIRILRSDKEILKTELLTVMESETDVQRRVDIHHVLQATQP